MENDDFDHIIDGYLRYVTGVKGLSAFTGSTYRADLRSLKEFFDISNTHSLSKFDREGVRTYLSWLTNLGYERASVVRKLSVLRGLFKWLLKQGYMDEDPVPRYSVMRKGKKLPKFLSIEEVERFFRAIEEDTCSESVKLVFYKHDSTISFSPLGPIDLSNSHSLFSESFLAASS